MTNRPAPVPPGRHPNWCRCAGCRRDIAEFESRQFKGTVGVAAAVIAFALLGFWPAIVWHGQNDMGGWRWDVNSTIACSIWWGVLLSPFLAAGIAGARKKRLLRPVRPPTAVAEALSIADAIGEQPVQQDPSPCRHPRAVPVTDVLGERVAWLCPDPPQGCGAQLDPGERSAELSPHAGWPPIRKTQRP